MDSNYYFYHCAYGVYTKIIYSLNYQAYTRNTKVKKATKQESINSSMVAISFVST